MLKKIDLYILRNIVASFFISLIIISVIMMIGDIVKIYDLIFGAGSSLKSICRVILYITLFLSIFTIPMALTLSINYVYSELSNNSEIVALRSSGISLLRIYLPALVFTFFVFVVLSYDVAFVGPHARYNYKSELIKAFRNKVYINIKPKTFYNFLGGIMWVNSVSPNHRKLYNVFFSDKSSVFVSKRAVLKDIQNGILAKFISVKMYSKKKIGWEFGAFKNYDVAFVLSEVNKNPSGIKYMMLNQLIESYKITHDKSMLYKINKMISLSLSVFPLSLIAFSFGITFARSGKSAGIVVSIFLFFAFYVLIMIGDSLFKSYGVIWPVYLPPILTFLFGSYLFYKKIRV